MKVTKKAEILARAILYHDLWSIGFPEEKMDERVDEAWPGQLDKAQSIIQWQNAVKCGLLDGETTEEETERWGDGPQSL